MIHLGEYLQMLPFTFAGQSAWSIRLFHYTRKSRLPFQVNGLTFGGELGTRTPDPLRVMQVL